MNTIAPIVSPFLDFWAYLTEDTRFKANTEVPGPWHTKWIQNQRLRVNDQFKKAQKKFHGEVELPSVLEDNWSRFTLFAFVERWVSIRQGQGFLANRFLFSNNNIGALNALRGSGFFGAFRGNLLNLFQFIGVQYQALKWSDGNLWKYIAYSSLLEIITFPIDTVKTLAYNDVTGSFKNIKDLLAKQQGLFNRQFKFWAGAWYKAWYNVFFTLNLWAWNEDKSWKYLTAPLWIFSYSFLTMKTRIQLAGSSLSFQQFSRDDTIINNIFAKEGPRCLFAGLVPFLAVNILFAWSFPKLLSAETKKSKLYEIVNQAPPEREEKYWT